MVAEVHEVAEELQTKLTGLCPQCHNIIDHLNIVYEKHNSVVTIRAGIVGATGAGKVRSLILLLCVCVCMYVSCVDGI